MTDERDESMAVSMPIVGSMVHYVSYGTPNGEYKQACRAAIVTASGAWVDTEVIDTGENARMLRQKWDALALALTVENPTGTFKNERITYCPGEPPEAPTDMCAGLNYCGGSWHNIVVPKSS